MTTSTETAAFDSFWQELRECVNAQLAACMEQVADCPPRLREAMAYSLLAGGKRLRPVLVLLACDACGGDWKHAMPAACAMEMIHTYSLVHDDLPAMDDDDLRRGRPTNHVVFGEAQAILAGDGLLTLAFEVLAKAAVPAEVTVACCADLANAAGWVGMVGGQVADLEAEGATELALQDLEAIHRRKTGRLLNSSLTMGARVAQADADRLKRLSEYGRCLGLAFQITDDLLDVRGDAEAMGKAVRKDATHGKLTYPALLGEEASLQKARDLIAEASDWIKPFGERGRHLDAMARFVLERDH